MTQWEQMKKEYSEIAVPEEGRQRVLAAMEKARRKKYRIRRILQYGSMAAALAVVIFAGGFSAIRQAGKSAENCADSQQSFKKVSEPVLPQNADCATEFISGGEYKESGTEYSFSAMPEAAAQDTVLSTKREEISKEILRQMEERMQTRGETYYIKSETYPDGFSLLKDTQAYYYSDGNLVITFAAGEVAPESQGTVEFIIPPEVFSLKE